MAVYLFGNISKGERALGGILAEVKRAYQNGENLLVVGDTLQRVKNMLLHFNTGKKKKPVVIVSGFCAKVWTEVKQTLEAEGLLFTDVQWIVGVAKDIEETKDFYVETYKGQLIGINGSREAEEVVPYIHRFVFVSEAERTHTVQVRRKEKGGKAYV
ncbi:hypothetical protein [Bacillus thuringiensis]|uniref:hypothetical protein n=1 Tax=Bacillus thuringiensis TaxID=1428 RepID=UPI000BFC449C|nr:hypothetical protein [Bacillus thuringiensis]PGT90099.1 hypothetical protein COD17_10135 [Bacillus thuringiensis]